MRIEKLTDLITAVTPLIIGVTGGVIALAMVITGSESQTGQMAVIAALCGSAGVVTPGQNRNDRGES